MRVNLLELLSVIRSNRQLFEAAILYKGVTDQDVCSRNESIKLHSICDLCPIYV